MKPIEAMKVKRVLRAAALGLAISAAASGQIAASQVARAKPDGHTLFFTTNTTHSANPALFKKLSYDPIKDFEPITLISETPFLLAIRADHPAKDAREFIAWLRANPDKAAYGFGNSTGQIAGAALAKATKIDMVPVPYKGTPAAASDVIGDRLAFMFIDTPAAQTYLKSGRLRALAISSAQRSSIMPDMPTLLEATGLPGLDIVAWSGAFAPAGTPREIVMTLNKAIRETTETPEYVQWRSKLASEVKTMSPEEFAAYVKSSIESWGARIREAGIVAQ